jgi:hypothetical protein
MKRLAFSLARVLTAATLVSACAPAAPKTAADDVWVTFEIVTCAVEAVANSCPAPVAGATVKLNTHRDPDTFITKTASADGRASFTVANLPRSFIVIEADGYLPSRVDVVTPDLAQPGKVNVFTLTKAQR